jgi:phosphatidylserine synthase
VLLSLTVPFGAILMVSTIRYRSFKTFFSMKFILMGCAFTFILLGVTYSFGNPRIFVYLCLVVSVMYIIQPLFSDQAFG